LFGLVLAACSSHSTAQAPYTPPVGDHVTEQTNGACPEPPSELRGTIPAGSACTEGADCAPACCQCGNGTNRSFSAVHCANKVCAGADDACTPASAADLAALCNVQ
ncbi:MAG: hypothetical protein ACREJX_00805, partial [Polyangiaceae bacterium]